MDDIEKDRSLIARSMCNEVMIALRRIMQSVYLHSHYLVRHFGLTGPQLVILQELSKFEELSVGKLSKATSLSQATVTGILERLEKRELICRRRSEKDRRRVLVHATESCRQLLDQAPPPLQEAFIEQFKDLENWEQAMILSSLQRLVSMMDAGKIKAAPILATGPIDETGEKYPLKNEHK